MIKRNTIQCSIVLETVNKLHNHATADEIYDVIAKDHPNISKGTVYRNLNQLSEIGEIRKMEIPGESYHFDHICSDHYHVKCAKCGKVFDVDMEFIKDLEKSIKNTHGFKFTGHNIIFSGICPDCDK